MTENKGKLLISGFVRTESPLHIGCGSDQRSDMDILLACEGKPFIPATSFVGVLRSLIKQNDAEFEKKADKFWGYARGEEGQQSAIRCSDLVCQSEKPIIIRDGIKLDSRNGMVKHQGKYDYEILERGAEFSLNMEFSYTSADYDFVKTMTATIYHLLANGKIRVGAKTNNGLGEIRLAENNTKIYRFDFSKKQNVFQWLIKRDKKDFSPENIIKAELLGTPFETAANRFCMDITLELKNSLIIRSYPGDPEMPDAVHMKSSDDWVLTGSSFKGAIRARAERIAKTIGKSDKIVKELFGFVDENKAGKGGSKKGKIRVREIVLPKFAAELQNRIKIDRFTGGTIEGALFDTMPLFCNSSEKVEKVIIEVPKCHPAEAGLLLLVLKDLWTGDLAVGGEKNVGRGVFKGTKAIIEWDNEKFVIDGNWSKMPSDTKKKLQERVTALHQEK